MASSSRASVSTRREGQGREEERETVAAIVYYQRHRHDQQTIQASPTTPSSSSRLDLLLFPHLLQQPNSLLHLLLQLPFAFASLPSHLRLRLRLRPLSFVFSVLLLRGDGQLPLCHAVVTLSLLCERTVSQLIHKTIHREPPSSSDDTMATVSSASQSWLPRCHAAVRA